MCLFCFTQPLELLLDGRPSAAMGQADPGWLCCQTQGPQACNFQQLFKRTSFSFTTTELLLLLQRHCGLLKGSSTNPVPHEDDAFTYKNMEHTRGNLPKAAARQQHANMHMSHSCACQVCAEQGCHTVTSPKRMQGAPQGSNALREVLPVNGTNNSHCFSVWQMKWVCWY